MSYSLQELGRALKKARLEKGLSQKAFSLKIGVPQSHISKIENGLVNLQLESLIELSRGLEMEFMLVPRSFIPAFNAFLRQKDSVKQTPAYSLDDEGEE